MSWFVAGKSYTQRRKPTLGVIYKFHHYYLQYCFNFSLIFNTQKYDKSDFDIKQQNGTKVVSDMKTKMEEILQNKIKTILVGYCLRHSQCRVNILDKLELFLELKKNYFVQAETLFARKLTFSHVVNFHSHLATAFDFCQPHTHTPNCML